MKFVLLALALVGTICATEEELTKLTNQIHSDLSTYLDDAQLKKIFTDLLQYYESTVDIKTAAIDLFKKVRDEVITSEQRIQVTKSISDAAEALGGVDKLRDLVFRTLDKFIEFFNPQLTQDRAAMTDLRTSGKESEISSFTFKKFEEYWSKTYGQKVVDLVKCSMSENEWNIVSKDAPMYMLINNFDMAYHC